MPWTDKIFKLNILLLDPLVQLIVLDSIKIYMKKMELFNQYLLKEIMMEIYVYGVYQIMNKIKSHCIYLSHMYMEMN